MDQSLTAADALTVMGILFVFVLIAFPVANWSARRAAARYVRHYWQTHCDEPLDESLVPSGWRPRTYSPTDSLDTSKPPQGETK